MQVDEKRWLLFDVTIGASGGAEVCELLKTFSLASVYIMTTDCQYLKTQLERIKKSLQKTFKDFVLEIVAECNLRIVNYLDVTLNLNDGSFRPCDKPDDIIQYINKEFNHPPNLIKHLPASIEKRLSNNSFDEKIFQESAIYYEDTLNKAGYIDKVAYHAPSTSNQENKNKNRQRNVIWFNLPCSKSVTTRIDQSFLYLIDTSQKTTPLTRYSTEITLKRVKAECKTSTQS